ncbi:MAG: efflux RND transporter periplasmic adaptor subunit, partial [Akkermansia sp.]|nr:efflux RND transporter periplasmic adaptor subunit [Akkermansia sp.]
TRITTPVDGTIVVRQVNVGQTVVSSMNATTLFLVARDLSKMQIWASVNEADIAKVKPGQEVRYTVDALPNETFKGTVNKIRPNATMSSNVVTYIVEVDIDNPDRKLLPYMSADANFIVKEIKDALLIPDAAFDFHPTRDMISESHRGRRPAPPAEGENLPAGINPADEESGGERALVWKKDGDSNKVIPVRVIKGLSDGTRTVVTPAAGETLKEGDELVTGISEITAATKPTTGNSPFGMKRPERRQRGTGGAAAKPGQHQAPSGRGGPRM